MRSIGALETVCGQCLASLRGTSSRAPGIRLSTSPSRLQQRQINSSSRLLSPQFQRKASSLSSERTAPLDEPSQVQSPPGLEYSDASANGNRVLLKPNNLFHPLTRSPSPDMRRRAAYIKQHAFCPHPSHAQTRQPISPDDPEARKAKTGALPPAHVRFECPDCGIPVSCSEEHWADDYEAHLEICDTLRQINEDDHDLRSGRFFPEFEYPGEQMDEALINMTNWDTLLYTRDFRAINEMRSLRQVTRMLTYPTTIASVLHELSPYSIRSGGRLTVEGLKSMSGIPPIPPTPPPSSLSSSTNITQHSATPSTPPAPAPAPASKASDPRRPPPGSSCSARAPNPRSHGRCGSSSRTCSRGPPST